MEVVVKNALKGGEFLIKETEAQNIFIPEERTEEQRLMEDTCKQFLEQEVYPNLDKIDSQEPGLMQSLQAFIAKSTVEAFKMAVLHRLSGLNVIGRYLPFDTPSQEVARGEFRAVVHAQGLRRTTLGDHAVQDTCDPLTRKAAIDFQGQALTGEIIDDAQHSHASSGSQRVIHEIERPFVVRRRQHRSADAHAHQLLASIPLHA
jgi:hypothetical protein